jgi:hypothetical protein
MRHWLLPPQSRCSQMKLMIQIVNLQTVHQVSSLTSIPATRCCRPLPIESRLQAIQPTTTNDTSVAFVRSFLTAHNNPIARDIFSNLRSSHRYCGQISGLIFLLRDENWFGTRHDGTQPTKLGVLTLQYIRFSGIQIESAKLTHFSSCYPWQCGLLYNNCIFTSVAMDSEAIITSSSSASSDPSASRQPSP